MQVPQEPTSRQRRKLQGRRTSPKEAASVDTADPPQQYSPFKAQNSPDFGHPNMTEVSHEGPLRLLCWQGAVATQWYCICLTLIVHVHCTLLQRSCVTLKVANAVTCM